MLADGLQGRTSELRRLGTDAGGYHDLRQVVAAAGLLERAGGHYAGLGGICLALLVVAVAAPFLIAPALAGAALSAALFAMGIVQAALLGHDAGHLAVFQRRSSNHYLGQLCWSLVAGVGFWYWANRHNRHHAHTNEAASDPDLCPSLLNALLGASNGAVPVLSIFLSGFTFRLEGWLYTVQALRGSRRGTELALLTVNLLLWALFVSRLGWRGGAVLLGSHILASVYLTAIVAPNHRGMPLWGNKTARAFLDQQVLGSRNLPSNRVLDFLYGGLNSQIEHHLFPTMSRPHLARARRITQAYCASVGLPYTDVSPVAAYRAMLATPASAMSVLLARPSNEKTTGVGHRSVSGVADGGA